MKTILGALLAGAWLLAAGPLAAGMQDFRLQNETGYQIDYVYVSPVDSDAWEEDILGQDALASGDWVDIEFDNAEEQCFWDLMAVYGDGEEAIWGGIDLCSLERITLYYNSADGQTWAVTD